MSIIRSGINKIRVIDNDIITLSSLNRHAFATRKDVGNLKVNVVQDYLKEINPNIIYEYFNSAFTIKEAEEYIKKGNPDYVLDCINDINSKCELIKYCDDNKIRLISCMESGGKMDPSCIRLGDLSTVQGETLSKKLKLFYKKKYNVKVPEIPIIYSIEKNSFNLSDFENKDEGENYQIELVKSLPMFASIPAIFGQALASFVLCELSGKNEYYFFLLSIVEMENKETLIPNKNKDKQSVSNIIGENNYKVGNVGFSKIIDDYIKFERKHNKDLYNIFNNKGK